MAEADDDPFPYFDVSTAAKTERLIAMSAGERIPQELPKDNMEATLKLAAFRPARQSVEDLFDFLRPLSTARLRTGEGLYRATP